MSTDEAAKELPPPLVGGGQGEGGALHGGTALLQHARSLRKDSTPAERKLWGGLRRGQLSVKFRRQMPLGRYIADFYCPAAKLLVELDGISHIESRTDEARDAWMMSRGLRVLRFSNQEVFSNLEGVLLHTKLAAVSPPPPSPLPQGEREFLRMLSPIRSVAHVR